MLPIHAYHAIQRTGSNASRCRQRRCSQNRSYVNRRYCGGQVNQRYEGSYIGRYTQLMRSSMTRHL